MLRCHPAGYLAAVKAAVPADGLGAAGRRYISCRRGRLTRPCGLSAGSARRWMRLWRMAALPLLAVRPPGHHAETARAMGFCLFGTAAIGVKRALDVHGLTRVALVDFDVHHGNGTQDLLWDEARCLFASSHQMPLFPGTGRAEEVGAHGQMLNLPLRAGSDGRAMRAAYERLVLPALADWKPDLVLVSRGVRRTSGRPSGRAGVGGRGFRLAGRAAVGGVGRAGGLDSGRRL